MVDRSIDILDPKFNDSLGQVDRDIPPLIRTKCTDMTRQCSNSFCCTTAVTSKGFHAPTQAVEEDLTEDYREERDELIAKLKASLKPKEKNGKLITRGFDWILVAITVLHVCGLCVVYCRLLINCEILLFTNCKVFHNSPYKGVFAA